MLGLHHLALGATLVAAANTGTFELDLIFPRNDTYAPVPLIPVVFAVQNPALATPLGLFLSWSIFEYGSHAGEGSQEIDLSNLNTSTSDPYFVTAYISTLADIESNWVFQWTLSTGGCSQTGANVTYTNQVEFIIFTTNQTAQAPDLEAATSAATCAMSQGQVFNVTAVEPVTDPRGFGIGLSSCAVLGPSPTTRNPCAAAIDASAASSITAAISLSRCEVTQFSCAATPSSTAKSEAGRSFVQPTICALIALGFLLFLVG